MSIVKAYLVMSVIGYVGFVGGSILPRLSSVIRFVGLLLFVGFLPLLLKELDMNITSLLINFLLRYLLLSMSIRDVCIRLVLFCNPEAIQLHELMPYNEVIEMV
jgi:hypothetical protein